MPPTDEATRLRLLLSDALEGWEEANTYVDAFFVEKHELDARLTRTRIALTEIDCERRGPRGDG